MKGIKSGIYQVIGNNEKISNIHNLILINNNLKKDKMIEKISLQDIPHCLLHKQQIKYICSCSTCGIPNPMICGHPDCLKVHGHPMNQMVSIGKLYDLLETNTSSMELLLKQTKDYYRQVRESIAHEIQKISDMMARALQYKHTHPVITLLMHQRYNQISPQRMSQLISYLRGAKTQRNTMEFVKNQIYEQLEKIQKYRLNLFNATDFKKLMLFDKIDMHSTQEIKLQNVSTNILDSQQEYKTIIAMLRKRYKKHVGQWELLYRASENSYSASSYLLNIQNRGPFLMLFKTDSDRKFGCFINSKADKKQGWLTDGAGLSFIFSLDHCQMYPIKQQARSRVKAVYIGEIGPQIGSGCDIYISDQCNMNQQSGSNLGGSYQLPGSLKYGSESSKNRLGGSQNFKIIQYQVYEIK